MHHNAVECNWKSKKYRPESLYCQVLHTISAVSAIIFRNLDIKHEIIKENGEIIFPEKLHKLQKTRKSTEPAGFAFCNNTDLLCRKEHYFLITQLPWRSGTGNGSVFISAQKSSTAFLTPLYCRLL